MNENNRKSGVLLHPTSFPSPYGIGDLGDGAYNFIDFLEKAGQKVWQVLPLGPTGYGDSPYQAFSSFAGQPLLISPDRLRDWGLLTHEDLADVPGWDPSRIDFGPVIQYKTSLFRKAYKRFLDSGEGELHHQFKEFSKKEKSWLSDYATFMAVKDAHDGVSWPEWDPEIAFPTEESLKHWRKKLSAEVKYYKFIQFLFFRQWNVLRAYANSKGIRIIGDIPIFVAYDSADVWANKDLFFLDAKGYPTSVAGVPPDYFSETGQLWGNPLYDWDKHKATGYSWWISRVAGSLQMVDILRIDHFRGFEAYWSVPYGSETAIHGEWKKGPYKDLFYAFQDALGKDLPIIAEDLGVITPEVEELRDHFHLPGMKILQFGFETLEENPFLPHQFTPNSVCYTGTHDNDTTLGWYLKAPEENRDKIRRYMNTDGMDIVWDFIRTSMGSVSTISVVPLQDILGLDSWARMNTPGVAAGNWQWRYRAEDLRPELAGRLLYLCTLYGRI
ncbi:4-alpha-glucanotransferase [Clostridiales bacterium F-3ap]|uniref:4-alpha-glucanotransferase n=1 Tax=Anaerotalea alkaliphila TaxID=2662126 RepID=A0A7X5KNQ9_9FIRM|nr:4-alpha-glucanotransferase [Anaerotalea alkaliphila]